MENLLIHLLIFNKISISEKNLVEIVGMVVNQNGRVLAMEVRAETSHWVQYSCIRVRWAAGYMPTQDQGGSSQTA